MKENRLIKLVCSRQCKGSFSSEVIDPYKSIKGKSEGFFVNFGRNFGQMEGYFWAIDQAISVSDVVYI